MGDSQRAGTHPDPSARLEHSSSSHSGPREMFDCAGGAHHFRLIIILRPALSWPLPHDTRVWTAQELRTFYGMTISEITSWLERAYVHGTKGLTPLLRTLKNGQDDLASPSKPSQKRLRLHSGQPPSSLTSTASRQLFGAYQSTP